MANLDVTHTNLVRTRTDRYEFDDEATALAFLSMGAALDIEFSAAALDGVPVDTAKLETPYELDEGWFRTTGDSAYRGEVK